MGWAEEVYIRTYRSVEALRDAQERRIELARVTGMKSPLTFHERKARRILKGSGRRN